MKKNIDIFDLSLKKNGEELCGDTVKIIQNDEQTCVVLSDGLGSGVKANILATLTSEIIARMLSENIPLDEVIATITKTLPVCSVRNIAYATFTFLKVNHRNLEYNIVNFDNPPSIWIKKGKAVEQKRTVKSFFGREVRQLSGTLAVGDFLCLISDGILHAGLGKQYNLGWGHENITSFIETRMQKKYSGAHELVHSVVSETFRLYGGEIGDDASCVGVLVRNPVSLMIFTGPPLMQENDKEIVERLLKFNGRKVICGGTTSNIVAEHSGREVEVDFSTITDEVPPLGKMQGIELTTEGILTMSRALEYIKESGLDPQKLPDIKNGAVMLAREILNADEIYFLVGQKINEFYQNPALLPHISIRKNLIREYAQVLLDKKNISIEYC